MRRGRLAMVLASLMVVMVVGIPRALLGASWAGWGASWGASPRQGPICWAFWALLGPIRRKC
eukprot:2964710-Pyramimonas_sp.AAC.1